MKFYIEKLTSIKFLIFRLCLSQDKVNTQVFIAWVQRGGNNVHFVSASLVQHTEILMSFSYKSLHI